MIGVTWLTTTMRCASNAASRPPTTPRTRVSTASNDSPPGGAVDGEPSHASSWSGHRFRTSANVSPSHSPKSHSMRSGSTCTGTPPASAAILSARSTQRCRGDVTTPAIGPRPATRVAVAWRLRPPARGQRHVAPAGVASLRRQLGLTVPHEDEPGRRPGRPRLPRPRSIVRSLMRYSSVDTMTDSLASFEKPSLCRRGP